MSKYRPKMGFVDVITKYGYPLISKDVREYINLAWVIDRQIGDLILPANMLKKYGTKYDLTKWIPLLRDSSIPISHMCCNVIKKSPSKVYEKVTRKIPILGTMAEESALRTSKLDKNGCNAFSNKTPYFPTYVLFGLNKMF